MKTKNVLRLSALSVAMLAATPSHAYVLSVMEVGPLLGITTAIQVSTTTTASTLTTMNASTIPMYSNMIKDAIAATNASVTSSTTEAARMQASTQVQTATQQQIAQAGNRYQLSDACGVTSAASGVGDASKVSITGGVTRGGGGGAPSGTNMTGGDSNFNESMNIFTGTAAPPTVEKQAMLSTAGACSTFVNGGLRKLYCSDAGLNTGASSGFPDADVRSETLFDGPQKDAWSANAQRRYTISADGVDRTATAAYMRNLNTPIELPQLRKTELTTDQGKQYMAARDTYEARMSFAQRPSNEWLSYITENKTLIPVAKQMIQGESYGEYAKEFLSKNMPQWESRGISMAGILALESSKRYLNKAWYVFMAGQSPDVHIKEQTNMQAQNLYMQYMILEQLMKMNAQLGQINGTNTRIEMNPELVRLHGAAAR